MSDSRPEVWLRGPVPGVHPLLQPVAHALLQAREELDGLMPGFPDSLLWTRPQGAASVGFHLQHLRGILDRLFTYARGDALSPAQLAYLASEGTPPDPTTRASDLIREFDQAVQTSLTELKEVDPATLTDGRNVGRAQFPSTRLGLYMHAAEHTMRHIGQLLVTVRVQQPGDGKAEDG